MFADYSSEVIGFASITRPKRNTNDSGVQTLERIFVEQAAQSSSVECISTQTDVPSQSLLEYDEASLTAFLRRISPLLNEELEIKTDFSHLETRHATHFDAKFICQHIYPAPMDMPQKKVSCLSWNCTGGTLAVGFSVAENHDTWCNHESKVELHRTTVTRSFHVNSCVTSLKFHFSEPSILAAGLYSGEVIVWDLRKDEEWAAVEGPQEHSSPVVFIGWMSDGLSANCCSAAADGTIIVRKVGYTTRSTTAIERFLITRGQLNPKLPDQHEGVQIMVVGQLTKDSYVAGIGGGGLLHCSLSPSQPESKNSGYKNPITMTYQPHRAAFTAIRPGAAGKVFATASSDGQIRVYKAFCAETQCVINIEGCPLDIFWTDSIAVFGVCGFKDTIRFVRVTTGETLDVELELNGGITLVAEVKEHRNIVAVGNMTGTVESWRWTTERS